MFYKLLSISMVTRTSSELNAKCSAQLHSNIHRKLNSRNCHVFDEIHQTDVHVFARCKNILSSEMGMLSSGMNICAWSYLGLGLTWLYSVNRQDMTLCCRELLILVDLIEGREEFVVVDIIIEMNIRE